MVESRNLSKMSNDQVHQSAKVVVCHLKSLHLKNRDCPHLKITPDTDKHFRTNFKPTRFIPIAKLGMARLRQ